MPTLSKLYYYPIKGLQGVELQRVGVEAGERLPMDRRYAIGDQSTNFDPDHPCHVRKQNLVVQMKHEKLAELKLDFDPQSLCLSLMHEGHNTDFELDSDSGRSALETYIDSFMGERIKAPSRLLSAPGLGFTDLNHKSVSIINLNSVRALEDKLGYPVDHRRFRANLYVDDLPAWEEENWLDKTLNINGVALKVYRITDRCAAINVNPVTGERDQTLQGLKKQFGHLNMGVYATIENSGELKIHTSVDRDGD